MKSDDRWKGDGFQTQLRKGFMAGQARKEDLLAKAVAIDGRKEFVGMRGFHPRE